MNSSSELEDGTRHKNQVRFSRAWQLRCVGCFLEEWCICLAQCYHAEFWRWGCEDTHPTHTHTQSHNPHVFKASVCSLDYLVLISGTADLCVIKRRRVSFFFVCASQISNLPPIENALELRVQSAWTWHTRHPPVAISLSLPLYLSPPLLTLHSDELRQETGADVRVVPQPDKRTLGNSRCVFSQGQ